MIVGINKIGLAVEFLKQNIKTQNTIILLQGDLASGKTTLVKEYVKSLGILDNVSSPTFSIQTIYNENIFHYDIYNKTLNDFISLGLLEEFEKDGIHFVEWGDDKLKRILKDYGFDILKINIIKKENKREYRIVI
ncbi:TsaE protein, required for threonylcarbamoyladenosine t(6)A37 formation in tRNA [hydrothermal vent metagenome]|uniref:tRNA threonylcarbamoyladenosine biosynthesis protein TsaE n=1 Tax=hydrothermal vent metagenome TaxID=652676 RepID=A0A3B1E5W6_9ZZZZ